MTNFITQNLEGEIAPTLPSPGKLDLPSRWILSRLMRLVGNVQRMFDIYLYGEAGQQVYDFLWGDFADWYIEISKHPLYQGDEQAKANTRRVLLHVLDTCLRLLHPYMPFVTEELWQHIPLDGEALILARWPQVDSTYIDEQAEREMEILMELVRGIRDVRKTYTVEPSKRIAAVITPGSHRAALEQYGYLFARLCNVSDIELLAEGDPAPDEAASIVESDVTVFLPLGALVDIGAECERLQAERDKLNEQINRSQATLNNEQFVTRAKADVVQRERDKLAALQASLGQIQERVDQLCTHR
jgi:valyl-tRNA synthetase